MQFNWASRVKYELWNEETSQYLRRQRGGRRGERHVEEVVAFILENGDISCSYLYWRLFCNIAKVISNINIYKHSLQERQSAALLAGLWTSICPTWGCDSLTIFGWYVWAGKDKRQLLAPQPRACAALSSIWCQIHQIVVYMHGFLSFIARRSSTTTAHSEDCECHLSSEIRRSSTFRGSSLAT